MMNETKLGLRLRQLRKASGMKQIDVAEAAGIKGSTLSSIENGHDNPGRETLITLAQIYKVSVDDLVALTPGPMPNAREIVEHPDELALLNFWRGLDDDQRRLIGSILNHSQAAPRKIG
jgi:transcriptional regulator with XRE-family HTH domain